MSVNGVHQVFARSFQLHRGYRFRDQLGGLRADNVHAQDFAVLLVGNYFDEPFVRADDGSLGISDEGEFADLDLAAALFGLGLGQTDAADLRLAIGGAGHAVSVNGLDWLAGNLAYSNNAFHS